MESLSNAGPSEGLRRGGLLQEAPESPPPEIERLPAKGKAENSEEDEEGVLARGRSSVGAGAFGDGGESDGVDVAGGAEDEEIRAGAVEEEETVRVGARDPV